MLAHNFTHMTFFLCFSKWSNFHINKAFRSPRERRTFDDEEIYHEISTCTNTIIFEMIDKFLQGKNREERGQITKFWHSVFDKTLTRFLSVRTYHYIRTRGFQKKLTTCYGYDNRLWVPFFGANEFFRTIYPLFREEVKAILGVFKNNLKVSN